MTGSLATEEKTGARQKHDAPIGIHARETKRWAGVRAGGGDGSRFDRINLAYSAAWRGVTASNDIF